MNRFTKPDLKKRILGSVNFSVIIFLLVLGLFLYGVSAISSSSVVNDRQILTDAINRDIIHCYAIEGMYPPSLDYIEKHYGLIYDKDKFIIDYEVFGSNIMPSVMVIERNN